MDFPSASGERMGDFLDIEELNTTKMLGIRWNAKANEFYFAQLSSRKCELLKTRCTIAIRKAFRSRWAGVFICG